jgi:hypothetical protein
MYLTDSELRRFQFRGKTVVIHLIHKGVFGRSGEMEIAGNESKMVSTTSHWRNRKRGSKLTGKDTLEHNLRKGKQRQESGKQESS